MYFHSSTAIFNSKGHLHLITLIVLMCLSTMLYSQQLREIRGKVTFNGTPVVGAVITNKTTPDPETGKSFSAKSDSQGEFKIQGRSNDKLLIEYVGYTSYEVSIGSQTNLDIQMEEEHHDLGTVVVVSGVSPRSTWVGAKIGYNLDGITEDNAFIGSAKISINPLAARFTSSKGSPYISIIGNFGDFISNTNKDSVKKQLTSLTQSVQGLSLGIGSTWELPINIGETSSNKVYFRPYVTSGYRLNTFTKVGPDSSTVNLSQWRTSLGIEFEGLEFSRGGVINLSVEGSFTKFGISRYQKIFTERKTNIKTLEATLILPFSNLIGFFVNGTFSPGLNAIYLIGIIVKPK